MSGATAAAGFAALAGLVASGAATGLDQWADSHAMPLAGKPGPMPTFLESLVPLLHADFQATGAAIAEIVTLPGQVVVSFLLVLLAARRLRSVRWIVAWAIGVGVELACRNALTRPALYRAGVHVLSFDSSWPSGHALRCALAAAALGAAWPRLRPVLTVWLAAAVVLLELAGFHTPTDIVGGLLLAVVASAAALGLARSGLLRRRAALRHAGARTSG